MERNISFTKVLLLILSSYACSIFAAQPSQIGIMPFEPMIYCDLGATRRLSDLQEAKKDETFRGYDIDLLL